MTEKIKGLLVINPIWKTDFVEDRQLKALNMSNKTKHVNVIVVSLGVTMLSLNSRTKMNIVPAMIMAADMRTLMMRCLVIIGSLTSRGGCFKTS